MFDCRKIAAERRTILALKQTRLVSSREHQSHCAREERFSSLVRFHSATPSYNRILNTTVSRKPSLWRTMMYVLVKSDQRSPNIPSIRSSVNWYKHFGPRIGLLGMKGPHIAKWQWEFVSRSSPWCAVWCYGDFQLVCSCLHGTYSVHGRPWMESPFNSQLWIYHH